MIQFDNYKIPSSSLRPSTTFSKTFRKTWLLRKLDLVQQSKRNDSLFVCPSVRTPLQLRNRRQQSISCQTDESMAKLTYRCQTDSFKPNYRVIINTKQKQQITDRGSQERFKQIDFCDYDLEYYMKRRYKN